MFTSEELGLITYALIFLRAVYQVDQSYKGNTLVEVTKLIDKIREM